MFLCYGEATGAENAAKRREFVACGPPEEGECLLSGGFQRGQSTEWRGEADHGKAGRSEVTFVQRSAEGRPKALWSVPGGSGSFADY